ncbi:cilia- and flagella-associated protein 99 isoform X3 [Hemicordylus capensis]|uniref:cilia- and flagella-associated protein 99 isoform X3 n=1 Tax=Hemicordylus capensis TaxID=884348 RepID=UPI00230488C2|nr:cilia- and flagella-associated protein 99 isoform X3 [Hemicordylus capensis]
MRILDISWMNQLRLYRLTLKNSINNSKMTSGPRKADLSRIQIYYHSNLPYVVFNVSDETFLMETLAGCIEYKPILDVVVNAFYIRDGKHCLLTERNLYVVVCYLATFRLEELGLQQFSRIIKSLDVAKICKFLRFFFSVMNLNTWIKDEWSQIYDSVYVKDNWIKPLLRWQPKVQQLIDQLTDKIAKYTTTTSKITEPKEFLLTVPTPRAILIPELIPLQEKTKPVPETTYKPPRWKEYLEGIKLKNRRKAEELLLEANISQFACAGPKLEHKSTINEIPKHAEKFQAQKIKGQIDNPPIKLNATAILREGVLYQRKVEEELNRIEHLLQGAQDPSEFLEWQKQMSKRDLDEQLAETECRRLQGKLSYEEAILAHQNCVQENKKKAEQRREEKMEIRQQCAERCLQESKERKKMVQQVIEGRKNVKQARIKTQKSKHQIVQEVSEESQEFLRQALEEEEETFKKRYKLIQQLRAIEYVPFLNNRFVDLTQTPEHGVLGEMSVAELRERLALLHEAQKKTEEEKRDLIVREKHIKEQLLLNKLDQISAFREAFGRAAALKQEEKKIKMQFSEGILKDERVLNLQKKIVEKSTERKIQTGHFKNTPLKYKEDSRRSWKSQKKSLQEDHWQKLEESRQQQFKMLQNGFMSREVARKMIAYEAGRTGTTACILRS